MLILIGRDGSTSRSPSTQRAAAGSCSDAAIFMTTALR
jgi:hypothetical protein